VRERLACRELVQDLVRQRAVIAAEPGQEGADGRQVQPGADGGGPFDDGQGLMHATIPQVLVRYPWYGRYGCVALTSTSSHVSG
jgi:hypothetical protein